jgi:o-succinylbenzoate synthase
MTIVDVQWRRYCIPLQHNFTTAHGDLTVREGAIVEIHTGEGITGIGEIAPMSEFAGSSLHAALAALPALSDSLRGCTLTAALGHIYAAIKAGAIPAPAACGLEVALLDALGKSDGLPVWRQLITCDQDTAITGSDVPRQIAVNAVIGAQTIEGAVDSARRAVAAGFRCVKLKVGRDIQEGLARLAAVRAAIGMDVHLRLDANEAWNLEQSITMLSQCERFSIQYVEQPLPAHDLTGMRLLRQSVRIPIAVDEALDGPASARRILAAEATDVFIVKPQLAGGLHAGREIIQMAAASAGALHLAAASPQITLECGLATLPLLTDDLLLDALPVHNGLLSVPTGPGLGVFLDRSALEQYACNSRG